MPKPKPATPSNWAYLDPADSSASSLTHSLQLAYNNGTLFTSLGSSVLVAVTPTTPHLMDTVAGDLTQERFYKLYKSLTPIQPHSTQSKARDAHIYAMANTLYFALRRSGVNQSLILRGECGSGKTSQAYLAMDHLARLARSGGASKRDEKLSLRVRALRTVLSGFGHASVPQSPDASQFGAFYELQFSDRGKFVGLKTIPMLFNRDRVNVEGDRSFHAFHALLAGAPNDTRHAFGLGPAPHSSNLTGVDDGTRYTQLMDALKVLGIGKRSAHYIFQLMAAVIHLGYIEFQEDEYNTQGSCAVRNHDVLHLVADMLEVDITLLHTVLTSRSNLVGRDLVTQLLTTQQACIHRDNLAKVLYHVLFSWIVEQANRKLCASDTLLKSCSFIYIVDFPGDAPSSRKSKQPTGHASLCKLTNDYITNFVNTRLLVHGNEDLRSQGLNISDTPFQRSGVNALESLDQENVEALPGDFISLIRGGNGHSGSRAAIFQAMFSEQTLNMEEYTANAKTAVRTRTLIRRTPSSTRRAARNSHMKNRTAATYTDQLQDLISAMDSTQVRVAFCISPNRPDNQAPSSNFESKTVSNQLTQLQIPKIVDHITVRNGEMSTRMPIPAFAEKYSILLPLDQQNGMPRDVNTRIMHRYSLTALDMHVGPSLVILHDDTWTFLETMLRKVELDQKLQAKMNRQAAENRTSLISVTSHFSDAVSEYSDGGTDDGGSEFDADSVYAESVTYPHSTSGPSVSNVKSRNLDPLLPTSIAPDSSKDDEKNPKLPKKKMTSSRRKWVCITWCLTWWIPTFCIRICGRMARPEVQMAWREKVAICLLIFYICAFQLFLIIGFGRVVCPAQNVLNVNELFFKKSSDLNQERLVGIHGAIYDLQDFDSTAYHSPTLLNSFAGLDISRGFPRVPQHYCEYAREFAPDFPPIGLDKPGNGSFVYNRHREFYERDLFLAQRRIDISLRRNVKALIGWDPNIVKNMSTDATGDNRNMFILGTRVYDIQPYINAAGSQRQFIPSEVIEYLRQNRGADLSDDPIFLNWWLNDLKLRDCFNNLFIIGVVDYRKSLRCQLTNYILLAFSVLLAAVIGGKFLAAIQLGAAGVPENFDKFVIIQVPSYTEGEDSLRKCIDSLSTMRYDDKRKLLFLVCDGMVMGSGNDRSTPQIILDILGVAPTVQPEPLSFHSLGEGMKQHNMAKVYSGLYETMGHLVPYIVVVKVGKPNESVKPGNRGKRDSQMILMRFLNKVAQDAPMSPLELELYHQIKNVIGVDPSFYEYCLMVDSDTVVFPDSLTRLAAAMMHDTKVMGVCGETQLANEKDSWATMIQVYEYYISHHLAKAFESLFGSVTCLPGCFTMYRIRTHNKSLPLLVSNGMIEDYGCKDVDTLHKKNLLHLGEDRYLTTLMLKHFPQMKTTFAQNAKCQTAAPESWNVLLSQRRRWINSTIHNLVELLRIEQLCGFCCFSMRFVVMIDLIGTLVQPAIMGYLIYLIYMVVISFMNNEPDGVPVLSLILLGIIYGLQAVLFLLKREWQHVGWMIIYILAIPVFSFFIPVYSFWKNDDFSWGNTRIVMGESGKQAVISGEEAQVFDISMIPHQPWSEYERELRAPGDEESQLGGLTRHSRLLEPPRDLKRANSSATLGTETSVTQRYSSTVSPPLTVSGVFPTDAEIYVEVERIVSSANLMLLTKKQVRSDLSVIFNVDLSSKKEYINSCISEVLAHANNTH